MTALTPLEADILTFIEDPDPDPATFDALALRLFAHQFQENAAYHRYCRTRRATPDRVRHWTDIPAVPLTAFKRLTLATMPPEDAGAIFMTSGSTDPSTRGRNHHPHLRLYDASLLRSFRDRFLPAGAATADAAVTGSDRMRIVVLNAPRGETPHSSIAHFFSTLVEQCGTADSCHLLRNGVLDVPAAVDAFVHAEETGEPLAVLGTSFSFVHLLDALAAEDRSFALPSGSRILDTGGFKGQSREVSADELREAFAHRLGVPDDHCANYYGMTEISTQYYDRTPLGLEAVAADPTSPSGSAQAPATGESDPGERAKVVPHWARLVVVDPLTRRPVPHGEPGLLLHLDLANIGSCQAVLSDDIGYAVGDDPTGGRGSSAVGGGDHLPNGEGSAVGNRLSGLGTADVVLRGRASGAEARGCSLALDEVLSANRTTPAAAPPLSPVTTTPSPTQHTHL